MKTSLEKLRSAAAFTAPFFVYVAAIAAEHAFSAPPQFGYPLRVALTLPVLLVSSRQIAADTWAVSRARPLASTAVGLAVFLIWIAPDALIGYRHHWLFANSIFGAVGTSLSADLRRNSLFLVIRAAGSTLVVPVIEELFWRGWLMRWLIKTDFQSIPLGTYAPFAFWMTAVLFGLEHGPFWEVGLAAGVIYNWWMLRTRSLAGCVLAHAVTNGALAAYVILASAWQYWL